jgi:hypothetical protein
MHLPRDEAFLFKPIQGSIQRAAGDGATDALIQLLPQRQDVRVIAEVEQGQQDELFPFAEKRRLWHVDVSFVGTEYTKEASLSNECGSGHFLYYF